MNSGRTTPAARRHFLKRITVAASFSALGGSFGWAKPIEMSRDIASVHPQEYSGAFANPLKGFRPDIPSDGGVGKGLDNPLVTVARHYIRWNQIENSADDGVDRILEFCNSHWAGIERRNIKIIPRVYLYWPEDEYWPADLRAGDYGSRNFLYRLEKLIAKLGEAWNHDPRVAYIETGIVGPCGEQWGPTPHAELKKVIGDTYTGAFPNKLCMIRYPWQWPEYRFGVFWDSWGTHKDTTRMLESLESPELAGSWKTRVRGGEISYGFGEPPGNDPDDTMSNTNHVDWAECLIRRGHWNHLGWVSYYDWKNPVTAANGQRLQKSFGYRFVIESVTFPARVNHGESFEVGFAVRNMGSSPFYYNWPVELSLLDEQDKTPVWREIFSDVQITKWLPGDGWMQFAGWNSEYNRFVLNENPARYRKAAETYQLRGQFTLPRSLPRGTYILALSILDPANEKPACRFAIQNYFNGGYHPIGRIGVGRNIESVELRGCRFDDLATDGTIGYGA